MIKQPEIDVEAIVVDRAYREALGKMGGPIDVMRAAIDALNANRREKPVSGLAEDARKVAQALEPFAKSPDVSWQIHQARDLWPIAESLPGKIEAMESWGTEQSCNAEILRLKLESIESGGAELGLRAQAQDAINQQTMRADAAESQLAERDAEIMRLREALEPFSNLRVTRLMVDGIKYDFRIDAADIRRARATLATPVAEKEEK